MSNVFFPKPEKTTVISIPESYKQNTYFHIILPNLKNSIKALCVRRDKSPISKQDDFEMYECTDFEEYTRPSNLNDGDHQEDTFVLNFEYTYIRLPHEIPEGTILNLVTKNDYDCDLLVLTFISDEEEMPFSDNVIRDSYEWCAVDYFGSNDYWKPEVAYRYIVSGHENCNWGECGSGCQVVSCGIQQGYASPSRQEIRLLRTTLYDK